MANSLESGRTTGGGVEIPKVVALNNNPSEKGNTQADAAINAGARESVMALMRPEASVIRKDGQQGTLYGPKAELWFKLLKKDPEALALAQADPKNSADMLALLEKFRYAKKYDLKLFTQFIKDSNGDAKVASNAVSSLINSGIKLDTVLKLMSDAPELVADPVVVHFLALHNLNLLSRIKTMGGIRFNELHTAFSSDSEYGSHQESPAYFMTLVFFGEKYSDKSAKDILKIAKDSVDKLLLATDNTIDINQALLIVSRSPDYDAFKIGEFVKLMTRCFPEMSDSMKNSGGLSILTLYPLTQNDSPLDLVKSVETLKSLGFSMNDLFAFGSALRTKHEKNPRLPFSLAVLTQDALLAKKKNPNLTADQLATYLNDTYSENKTNTVADNDFVSNLRRNERFNDAMKDSDYFGKSFMKYEPSAEKVIAVYEDALRSALPLTPEAYREFLEHVGNFEALATLIKSTEEIGLNGYERLHLLSTLSSRRENALEYLDALQQSSMYSKNWAHYVIQNSGNIDEFKENIPKTPEQRDAYLNAHQDPINGLTTSPVELVNPFGTDEEEVFVSSN